MNFEPNQETMIRERAYQIWEREGCPEGRAQAHWYEAEQEVAPAAGLAPAKGGGQRRADAGGRKRNSPKPNG